MRKRGVEVLVRWFQLGERLRAVNPERMAEVEAIVRDIVEAQEEMAARDGRAVHAQKRYSA